MKERPIIMQAESVRAILAGRKTMMRRVVKPQPDMYVVGNAYGLVWGDGPKAKVKGGSDWLAKYCPYGQVGDHLWVRESVDVYVGGSFEQYDNGLRAWQETFELRYLADNHTRRLPFFNGLPEDEQGQGVDYVMLKRMSERDSVVPSIHMPRWASRITLEVTGVRVERVQEISEADAMAEGIETELRDMSLEARDYSRDNEWFQSWGDDESIGYTNYVNEDELYRSSFRTLWDSVNAKRGYSWDVNPWVFVVEFRVV